VTASVANGRVSGTANFPSGIGRDNGEGVGGEARILVVDDDSSLLVAITGFLRGQGFVVASAANGVDAIQVAEVFHPELMLCDIDMPELDGFGVLDSVLASERLWNIPIIFISGYGKPESIRKGMNCGAADYLVKPVNPEELELTIRSRLAIERARRRRMSLEQSRTFESAAESGPDGSVPSPLSASHSARSGQASGDNALPTTHDASSGMSCDLEFLNACRSGSVRKQPAVSNLKQVLMGVIDSAPSPERVQLRWSFDSNSILIDSKLLQRGLRPVIVNALQYSVNPVVVEVRSGSDQTLEIRVTDNGRGIPVADIGRVMSPFHRGANVGAIPGNGLGLTVAKACVELLGGSLDLESDPEVRTCAILRLPYRTAEEGAGATADESSGAPTQGRQKVGSKLSILRIQRSPRLEADGLDPVVACPSVSSVCEADSVLEGARMVVRESFDVVFIDAELLPDARVSLLPDLLPGAAVVVVDAGHGATKVRAGDVGVVLEWPTTPERVTELLSELSVQRAEPGVPAPPDSFWVKTSSGRCLVAVDTIRCLLAYGEYSRIHWGDGQEVLLRKSLKEWETELPASKFLRVHRNSIVNLDYLERVSADSGGGKLLHIKGVKQPVAVSLRKAVELNRRLRPVTLLTTATRLPGHRGVLTTNDEESGTVSDR